MIDPQSPETWGYHFFLEPEGEAAGKLSEIIETLAVRHGGLAFPPHVTLAGPLTGTEAEVSERMQALASATAPFTLTLGELSGEPSFFRAFYAHVSTEPALLRLRQMTDADEPYTPHLSLFYGLIDGAERDAMREAARDVPGTQFLVPGISLYRTDGAAEGWQKLAFAPFSA